MDKPICLMLGARKHDLVPGEGQFEYIRLDLNPASQADIIADATKLPYDDCSVEAVFASHLLEHLSPRRHGNVLLEWYRVLKPGGELLLAVPNMTLAAEYLLTDPEKVIYTSAAGPITAMDMMYGLETVSEGVFMYHRWGFTRETLALRANQMEWADGIVWEMRYANPYDRSEVRLYGRKPGEHDWTGWDLDCTKTGDPDSIRLGVIPT